MSVGLCFTQQYEEEHIRVYVGDSSLFFLSSSIILSRNFFKVIIIQRA